MRLRLLLLPIFLACCSPPTADSVAASPEPAQHAVRHPESGLQVVPLAIVQDDQRHLFEVEVARSEAEQARGLMYRTEMGPDEGMLFPRETPRQARFWMKNTVIPLDIIFIGVDGRISNIVADATPYSLTPRISDGPVTAILELNGGRAAELGITPGARVEW